MVQPQLEFGSFYRFMVSFGVALIVAAFLGAHFYLSGDYVMLESNSRLEVLFAVTLSLSFAIGLLLVVVFGVKWQKRQKQEDMRDDDRASAEIERMKNEADRIKQETREYTRPMTDEEKDREAYEEAEAEGISPNVEGDDGRGLIVRSEDEIRSRASEIRSLESAALALIEERFSLRYEVLAEYKGKSYSYDAICLPKEGGRPVIIEIKHRASTSAPSLPMALNQFYVALLAYDDSVGVDSKGIVWVTMPASDVEWNGESVRSQFRRWCDSAGIPEGKIELELHSVEGLSR